MSEHQHQAQQGAHGPPRADGVKDPVCGMTVNPDTAKHRHVHNGQPYYFCGGRCREKFAADPGKHLDPAARAAEPVVAGAIYTCPMHPEIRQVGPGACPICGMALEPELVTAEAGPNPELADMARRLWIGLALAVPVFALEMGSHLLDLHRWIGQQTSNWVQLLLATPHNGQPYYFCGGRCREKFAADPGKYLDPAARAAEHMAVLGGVGVDRHAARWCCGPACRSSNAAGRRSGRATSTCSR